MLYRVRKIRNTLTNNEELIMYPTNLTEREKKLGFRILQMSNPKSLYIGEPATVDAVVYELDQSNRIVKIEWTDGSVRYSHQRLITMTRQHQSCSEWKPVGKPTSDPVGAIALARTAIKK